jgi:hypothetical protein
VKDKGRQGNSQGASGDFDVKILISGYLATKKSMQHYLPPLGASEIHRNTTTPL